MAIETRFDGTVKAFGSTSATGEKRIFGDDTNDSDNIDDQQTAEYLRGWAGGLDVNGFPPMEYFNALGFTLSKYIAYLYQAGVSEWNNNQDYYINSHVVGEDGKIYRAKSGIEGVPNSGNNPINDSINWTSIIEENSVNTIADLKNLEQEEGKIWLLGYYQAGDKDPLVYYWDSLSTEPDNGGTIIKVNNITTGRWKASDSKTVSVEDFGAKGDNINDDTNSINSALSIGGKIKFTRGTYKITGSLEYIGDKSIEIDGESSTLNCITSEMGTVLKISPSSKIDSCAVKNLKIDGNHVAKIGIHVSSGVNTIVSVSIENNQVLNLDNVSSSSSVIGIRVDADKLSVVDITSNFIFNITRTQVNPGIIASVGIGVYNLNTVANINNNAINGIESPTGDADADGIQVFSLNKLISPAERQASAPRIYNNRIQNCKGRFIKLQSSNGKIYSNYMSNVGIELIDNFHAVDAQFGGVDIFDNDVRIGTFTGGSSLAVFSLQGQATGYFENIYKVHDNSIYTEQDIPYFVTVTNSGGTNTNMTLDIYSNTIKSVNNDKVVSTGIQLDIPSTMDNASVSIYNNKIPTGSGSLLKFYNKVEVEDDITGPLISDLLSLRVTGNENAIPTSTSDVLNASQNIPYLQNIVFSDNQGYTRSGLSLKGCDVLLLPEGNSFYYATDGLSAGLLNAPSGYNRYVTVETSGEQKIKITQIAGNDFAVIRKQTGVAYKYIGTLIP